jgi:hypothetical protein
MHVNCRGELQPRVFARVGEIIWLRFLICGAAMVVSLKCTSAFGSYITMVTDFSVAVKSEGLTLVVMAENRGDVPALDVQFEIIVDERVLAGPVERLLGVAGKTSAAFSMTDVFSPPGRYPIVIRTYYKDASGYPFTALTVGFYDYKSTGMPAVSISGHATKLSVDGKGQLKFLVRNDGLAGQKIDLTLFVPNELAASRERSAIEIGPQQEETLVYEVENYSALANSRYTILLVGWYEDAGNRFGVAGSAVVQVVGDVKSVVQPIWIWVVLGGVMPGVIIFLRLKKRLAEKPIDRYCLRKNWK